MRVLDLVNHLTNLNACSRYLHGLKGLHPEGLVDLEEVWKETPPVSKIWYLCREGWEDPREPVVWAFWAGAANRNPNYLLDYADLLVNGGHGKLPLRSGLGGIVTECCDELVQRLVYPDGEVNRYEVANLADDLLLGSVHDMDWEEFDKHITITFPFHKIRKPGDTHAPEHPVGRRA